MVKNHVLNYKYQAIVNKETGETKLVPLLPVTFKGPNGKSREFSGLLDSGSDTILIPIELADYFGVAVTELPNPIGGVGGKVKGFEGVIHFELGAGPRRRIYGNIPIRFCEKLRAILIGREPVFNDYLILFKDFEDKVTLTPKETSIQKKKKK